MTLEEEYTAISGGKILDALAIAKQVLTDITCYPHIMYALECCGLSLSEGTSLADQVRCALTEEGFSGV